MKKLANIGVKWCLVTAIGMATVNISISQNGDWYWQNPVPQGNQLYDVALLEDERLVAVGASGTIISSNDGGLTWNTHESNVSSTLRAVHFVDPNNGWAAGHYDFDADGQRLDGVILHTTDGGNSWQAQQSHTENHIRDLHFVDEDNGMAVAGSELITTNDGGNTWEVEDLGGTLNALHFVDAQHGWIVGNSGVFYHTENGGQTWEQLEWEPERAGADDLDDVYFVNNQLGWAVGQTIIRTDDAGETWQEIETTLSEELHAVHFVNEETGWIAGRPARIKSTRNGGEDWVNQDWDNSEGSGTIQPVRHQAIAMKDEQTGWIVGDYGTVLYTNDGGRNWTDLSYGAVWSNNLNDIFFTDSRKGWAVGSGGTMLYTVDGGLNWEVSMTPTTAEFKSLAQPDEETGWVVADRGQIWKVVEDEFHWDGREYYEQESGTSENLYHVQFLDTLAGWAAGEEVMIHTEDGGQTWQEIFSEEDVIFNEFHFHDDQTGWAIVEVPINFSETAEIWLTEDGGQSWEVQHSDEEITIRSLHFVDGQHGWAAARGDGLADPSKILSTSNGGESWEEQLVNSDYRFEAIHFINSEEGWVVGNSFVQDRLFYTEDGGQSWQSNPLPAIDFLDLHFFDDGTGWISGDRGRIIHNSEAITQQPGQSTGDFPFDGTTNLNLPIELRWNPTEFGVQYNLQVATNPEFEGSIIDRSGISAYRYELDDEEFFNPVNTYYWRVRSHNSFEIGEWSDVWSFETSEAVSSGYDTQLPTEPELSQNYPNPFNPVTQIEFQVPEQQHVTLEIYNVLGQKVSVLVNENRPAGSHQVEFDGSNLASGVYLYRLSAGEQILTKQMMLVK